MTQSLRPPPLHIGFACVLVTAYLAYSIIHMSNINNKIDEWEKSYQTINKDVSAFTKVSDPKKYVYMLKN